MITATTQTQGHRHKQLNTLISYGLFLLANTMESQWFDCLSLHEDKAENV